MLSVHVPPGAGDRLLGQDADHFAGLLDELGPDRDLADEAEPWPDDWPDWRLMSDLKALPGVGPSANKLLAHLPTSTSRTGARRRPSQP